MTRSIVVGELLLAWPWVEGWCSVTQVTGKPEPRQWAWERTVRACFLGQLLELENCVYSPTILCHYTIPAVLPSTIQPYQLPAFYQRFYYHKHPHANSVYLYITSTILLQGLIYSTLHGHIWRLFFCLPCWRAFSNILFFSCQAERFIEFILSMPFYIQISFVWDILLPSIPHSWTGLLLPALMDQPGVNFRPSRQTTLYIHPLPTYQFLLPSCSFSTTTFPCLASCSVC